MTMETSAKRIKIDDCEQSNNEESDGEQSSREESDVEQSSREESDVEERDGEQSSNEESNVEQSSSKGTLSLTEEEKLVAEKEARLEKREKRLAQKERKVTELTVKETSLTERIEALEGTLNKEQKRMRRELINCRREIIIDRRTAEKAVERQERQVEELEKMKDEVMKERKKLTERRRICEKFLRQVQDVPPSISTESVVSNLFIKGLECCGSMDNKITPPDIASCTMHTYTPFINRDTDTDIENEPLQANIPVDVQQYRKRIRELENQVQECQAENAKLKNQNKKIKAENAKLKREIKELREKPKSEGDEEEEEEKKPSIPLMGHPNPKLVAQFAAQVSDAKERSNSNLQQMLVNFDFGLQSACRKALDLGFTKILSCPTCGRHLTSPQGYCRHKCNEEKKTLPTEFLDF